MLSRVSTMSCEVLTYLPHEHFISWSKYCPFTPSAWNNLALTARIFMKFEYFFFRKSTERTQVSLKCHKNSGCFTCRSMWFMIILCCILFRMRYVLDKRCGKSKHTFIFNSFFSENCVVYEIMWKNIVESDALHAW